MNNINKYCAFALAVALSVLPAYAKTAQTQDQTSEQTMPAEATGDELEEVPLPTPANPHNPSNPTLAELQSADDNALSLANTDLLAKNAELQNRVDELTTQVNVLVNERSGQLYLYGVFTVFITFGIGFGVAWFIFGRRKANW